MQDDGAFVLDDVQDSSLTALKGGDLWFWMIDHTCVDDGRLVLWFCMCPEFAAATTHQVPPAAESRLHKWHHTWLVQQAGSLVQLEYVAAVSKLVLRICQLSDALLPGHYRTFPAFLFS